MSEHLGVLARSIVLAAIMVAVGSPELDLRQHLGVSALAATASAADAGGNGRACLEPAGQRANGLDCITSLGPSHFAGRVRAMVVRQGTSDVITAATATGGLWQTQNGGGSWTPVADLPSLVFSSIAADPGNPDVMYAGSGELQISADGVEQGAEAGFTLRSSHRGVGIFKSTDGGAHWSLLAGTAKSKDFFYVSRIAVSPSNSNTLLAATATGLWRSGDGGVTWGVPITFLGVKRIVHLPLVAGTFRDVKFHPTDPANAVAAGLTSRVYFSTDGEALTWTQSTLPSAIATSNTRVELAPAPAQAGVWVAAHIQATNDLSPINILRSINRGSSFVLQVPASAVPCVNNRAYSGALFVPPNAEQFVWVAGSGVGPGGPFPGICLVNMANGSSSVFYADTIHNDTHALVDGGIPACGDHTIVLAGDGGIFRIKDVTSPLGGTCLGAVNLNNNLVNQQFYGAAINPSGIIVGGAQDIGTLHRATNGTWTAFSCCDGLAGSDGTTTAADPTQLDLFYFGNSQARLFRSGAFGGADSIIGSGTTALGDSSGSCMGPTPILLDPNNPSTLYVGCERLWRSTNVNALLASSVAWTPIKPKDTTSTFLITSMAIAPWNRNVMWVGTLNGSLPGQLWMTTQLASCTASSNCFTQVLDPDGVLPARPVSGVALHPTDQSRVFVSFSGWTTTDYTTVSNNLFVGVKASDGKFHFSDISAQLQPGPVWSVAVGPGGKIAAGTEFGMALSYDGGATWFYIGVPVPIAGLTWLNSTEVLVTTYGRGASVASVPASLP